MSYTKQTWANGDIITAAKLNHMEDGIAGVEADVSSLDTKLLASMPHDTASGSIASFPDGAAAPVKALTVAVEPVQDLHGYNAPWPAGGGVNKFNIDRTEGTPDPSLPPATTSPRVMDTAHHFIGITRNNYYDKTRVTSFATSGTEISVSVNAGGYGIGFPVAVSAETAYTLSFVNISNGKINLGYYDASWNYLSDRDGTAPPYTFTTPENCAYVVLVVTPNVASSPATIKDVQLELGSTATAWTPYSNECPIGGWTECKVTRTGKNLCDSAAFESGLLATAIGSDINAVTSATRYAHSGIMPAKSALAVTVKTLDLSKIDYASIVAYVGDKVAWTAAQSFSSSVMSKTWTIPANTYEKLRINICAPAGVTADASNAEIQVEIGSATAYEAYQGQTYTIDLDGTRYGGTLDVTTGKLMVDRAMVDMGTLNWSSWEQGGSLIFNSHISAKMPVRDVPCISSQYAYNPAIVSSWSDLLNGQMTGQAGGDVVYVRDTRYSSNADFKTGVSGVQLVYPLATPIEVDLDPVTIETLLGTNNIFADCGDTTVDYYADTTLFVNKKIAAAVAALS